MHLPFRLWHLNEVLSKFQPTLGPLDSYIQAYFHANRSLGSGDRRWIADHTYAIWRHIIILHALMGITSCSRREQWLELLALWLTEFKSRQLPLSEPKLSVKPPHTATHSPLLQTLSFQERSGLPPVIYEALAKRYGSERALAIGLSQLSPAPVFIRANPLKMERNQLIELLPSEWSAEPMEQLPHAITLKGRPQLTKHPLYLKGCYEIQDAGSQWLADKLEAKPGESICDFCAGSGGKTLAFAYRLEGKGQLFLHDIRTHALSSAKQRLRRAGIQNAQIIETKKLMKSTYHEYFDALFIDAPCSGSGTLRRNPDLRARIDQAMLTRLRQTNITILEQALSRLKPGGQAIFATCSILPEENEVFLEKLLKDHPSFQEIEITASESRLPSTQSDGFFYAKLYKRKL